MNNFVIKSLISCFSIIGLFGFLFTVKNFYEMHLEMKKYEALKEKLHAISQNKIFPTKSNLSIAKHHLQILQDIKALFGHGLPPIHKFSDESTMQVKSNDILADLKYCTNLQGIKINETCSLEFMQIFSTEKILSNTETNSLEKQSQSILKALQILVSANPREISSVKSEFFESLHENSDALNTLHSSQIKNLMRSVEFYISFTGTTETLCKFLNDTHSFAVPIFLINLKVQPSESEKNLLVFTTNLALYYFEK